MTQPQRCSKICYEQKKDARRALLLNWKYGQTNPEFSAWRSSRGAIYYCRLCGGYHLTSQRGKDNQL